MLISTPGTMLLANSCFLVSLILASTVSTAAFTSPPINFGNLGLVFPLRSRSWLLGIGSASYRNIPPLVKAVRRIQLERNIFQTIICSDDAGKNSEDLPMSILQQRIAEIQDSEVLKDRRCAKNWNEGRCSTRVVAVLNDDWVRQVSQRRKHQNPSLPQPLFSVNIYASHFSTM
jgi:hypothetical protein